MLRSRVVQFLTFVILAGLTVWVAALTISARGEVPDTTPIPVTLRSPTSSEITILGRDRIVAGEIDVKIRAGISHPDGAIRRIAATVRRPPACTHPTLHIRHGGCGEA